MKIIVNGAALATTSATLAELMLELDTTESVVATAVNEEFVPVSGRTARRLRDGDRVEVVAPQQGG